MLRIWGRLSSINVQKVVWCANELGVAYERIDAGRQHGVVNTPQYLSKNPMGQIPLIEDEDFVLWESNPIVRYLCAKHALGSLYPEPLQARADADRWMDWQTTELSRAMGPAFMQSVRTPASERRQVLIDESVARTEPLMEILDARLAGRAFVCGAQFTMSDIVLGCAAHRWLGLPADQVTRIARPAVEAWYARLMARPATRGVLTLPLQ
jgi:glutathione S-transferase